MADSKQIKFQFVVDQGSAREVNRVLDEMIKKAQDLGKALQGVGGGGGGILGGVRAGSGTPSSQSTLAGRGGSASQRGGTFTQILGGSADGFKKLASESGAAMKAMTDSLQRAASQQQSAVDKLSKELDALAKMYDKVGGKASGAFGEKLQGLILNKAQEVQDSRRELSKLRQMEGDQMAGPRDDTVIPGEAKRGFGGRMKDAYAQGGVRGLMGAEMAPGFGGGRFGMSGVGTIGQALALAAVGKWGYDEVREGGGGIFSSDPNNAGQGAMDLRAKSRRGKLLNSRIDALRGGDISQLIVREDIARDSATEKYYQQQMDAASTAEAYAKGGMEGLGKLPLIKQALGLVGKGGGEGTALEGLTTAEIQSKLLENIQSVEAKQSDNVDTHQRLKDFQYYQSSLGSRTNAQRVMGLTLHGKDGRGGPQGTYGNLAGWATEQALNPDQVVSNFGSLRMMGGSKFAGQMAKYETLSQAGGYSGFGQLAAHAQGGGGTAQQAFQLARGALGGGIATGAGMQLGGLMFGYNPLGTTSGEGLLAASQMGIDWKSLNEGQQFNKVQALGGGMKGLNAVATGTLDNESLGASVLSAKRILGQDTTNPNRLGTRAIDYLASGMDLKQMYDIGQRGGKMTDKMDVYGIGRSDVRQQFSAKISSLFKSQLDDPAVAPGLKKLIGGLDADAASVAAGGPEGNTLQRLLGKGKGSLSAAEKKQINVALSNRTGMGGEEAEAAREVLGGFGLGIKNYKIKTGDALGAKLSGPEQASAAAAAEEVRLREAGLKTDDPTAKIKGGHEAAKAQKDFGSNLGAEVSDVAAHLARLATAISKATEKIEGKSGMREKATGG